MADFFTGTRGMLLQWLLSPFIWLVIIFGICLMVFGFLYIRKRRRLIYPCAEFVTLGNGKMGVNTLKCGWFGKEKRLFGLWDMGEEVLKTDSGERIYEFSSEDFQEVNGKRGVVVFRDPLNQNVLISINKLKVINEELVAEIAPASFRDTALEIVKDAERETKDKLDQVLQFMMWAGVILFSLVSIIIITQMVKNGQAEAGKLIIDAGGKCRESCQEIVGQVLSTIKSTTAP